MFKGPILKPESRLMMDAPPLIPAIDLLYRRYLNDESSAAFVDAVTAHYRISTLVRLAQAGQPVTRRAAVLALGFIAEYSVNETLGRALSDSDRAVRVLAEHGIRQVWFRQGDENQQRLVKQCSRFNTRGEYGDAIELASAIIDCGGSEIGEAFHQRANALFAVSQFEEAIEDYRETLYLNRYHFLAAIGLANCHLQTDDVSEALASFRLSLTMHPDLESVRGQIARLAKIVEG
ncbi:MAG TPA: hypothetical protein PKD54_08910 [Pirellulaceae bacterium]|nr:hypothetical protein [Pirellulaceae bacterium]